ncbi:DUF3293 domain-containing protein [Opitutales bacterium]|nr:DUF3293 domain-containing protein [Opitutales bacterium]
MNPHYFNTIFLFDELPKNLPSSFAIITAYNPMDKKVSARENQYSDIKLCKQIGNIDLVHTIWGSSPNRTHQEKSYLTKLSKEDAINIGNDYQQKAIYYVERGNLQLIDCKSREEYDLDKFCKRLHLIRP